MDQSGCRTILCSQILKTAHGHRSYHRHTGIDPHFTSLSSTISLELFASPSFTPLAFVFAPLASAFTSIISVAVFHLSSFRR